MKVGFSDLGAWVEQEDFCDECEFLRRTGWDESLCDSCAEPDHEQPNDLIALFSTVTDLRSSLITLNSRTTCSTLRQAAAKSVDEAVRHVERWIAVLEADDTSVVTSLAA